jgi:hypothetical protein
MNEKQADELWTRYLDGELTARERAALNQSVTRHYERRESLVGDFELDGMLRVLGHIDATADDFVAQVTGRLDVADDEVDVFPTTSEAMKSEEQTGWSSSLKSPVPPPVPPPVVPVSLDETTNSDCESKVGRAVSLDPYAKARRRARWTFAISAAALIVIALVGAIVVAKHDADRVAEDPDQKQPPASDGGQRDTNHQELVVDQPKNQIVEERPLKDDNSVPNVVHVPVPRDSDKPVPKPDDRGVVGIDDRKSPADLKTDGSNPGALPRDGSKVVARLTKSLHAIWQEETPAELTSKPLYLESGIVELTMNDGVILTVLGPADFQLDSTGRVLLSEGRLNALVPAQATGFTVETPSSHVVDLGTEFDVSVDKNGETAVRVHQGEVELASLDAESKKWNLHKGQFKTLRRDGVSHDFHLATNLDRSGRGTVSINGIQFAVMDRKQFDVARKRVNEEMAQFRRDVASQPDTKYNGLMNLSGNPLRFINSSQFLLARRQTNDHFDAVQRLLDRTGSFRGSININGTEIKFDNMQDLLDQNEWMKKMGLGVPTGGVGNLRELLKIQEEMMRKLREGEAGAEGKPDMRGSIDIDGKSIDFGNLEELLRLRDSLGGASGLRDVDRRKRLEDMRRRHEEARDRNRERLKKAAPTEPKDTKTP